MSPRIDPKLKAYFKEIARRIVSEDRTARKLGISQNTIGKITRAITQAYELGQKGIGFTDLSGSSRRPNAIDWITIPPRARETLMAMSSGLSNRVSTADGQLHKIERLSDGPQPRWRIIRDVRLDSNTRTIAHGGVSPLIKMNLVEPVDEESDIYQLSEIGMATCQEYWRRSDADDLALPAISLR